MRRGAAAILCAVVMLAGCAEWRRPPPARHVSLKDDTPKPEKPERPEASIEDRARREQAEWCGQRHLQHSAGTLNESEEQKRARDDQCSELHKRDYVQ